MKEQSPHSASPAPSERSPLKVGITGGIGSGKSIVCRVFQTLGIPVFDADHAAKYLMQHDAQLIAAITGLLGADAYLQGSLNRAWIAQQVYADAAKLHQLNSLVHPATLAWGRTWMQQQHTPYVIKEAAIFFESGSHTDMDVMVGVYAPIPLRMARAMKRSDLTADRVQAIMDKQMPEDEKMKRCDHVIVNDDVQALLPQVLRLHELLINQASFL